MKLTSREIACLTRIEERRRSRKIGSWISLIMIVVLSIADMSFGWFGGDLLAVFAIFLGITISTLANEYLGVSDKDKLFDLLQRYVNSDPEAVRQISETVSAGRHAA